MYSIKVLLRPVRYFYWGATEVLYDGVKESITITVGIKKTIVALTCRVRVRVRDTKTLQKKLKYYQNAS